MATSLRCVVFASAIALTGCSAPGFLYTDIVMPYTLDMNRTSAGSRRITIDEYRIREPVSGYGIYALWQNRDVQAAAKQANMSRIHYADRRIFSILGGIYRKRSLIIYGE